MKHLTTAFIAVLILALFVPVFLVAHAEPNPAGVNNTSQGVNNVSNSTVLVNPLGPTTTDLPEFLNKILEFVVRIGAIVVTLSLIYVGYLFVMARGVPGKIEEARRALEYVIIGALILLGAQVIASGIQATVQALSVG